MEKQGIFMFRPSVDLKVIRDKACLVKSQIFSTSHGAKFALQKYVIGQIENGEEYPTVLPDIIATMPPGTTL